MKPAADQEESKAKIDGGTTSAKSGAAFLGFAYDLLRVEPRDRDVEVDTLLRWVMSTDAI